tara:strand:+ start:6740 stop:7552 length:813 start_codon:yes stop_codon:yes gene_type:complete
MKFISPAKINLGLSVLKKRPDNFHDIETIFQFLDWGDEIFISLEVDKTEIICPEITREENIVLKAIKLLRKETGTKKNAHIRIEKNIPVGSGLGGGSSNAASVLKILNILWELNLEEDYLEFISTALGADVPIFVKGKAAKANGIGNIFTDVDPKEKIILLFLPKCRISTSEAFNEVNIDDYPLGKKIKHLNFFEKWARNKYPEIESIFNWIEEYSYGNLSGTGSSIYVKFNSFDEASKMMDNAPKSINCFITKSLNRSPLLDVLNKIGV